MWLVNGSFFDPDDPRLMAPRFPKFPTRSP